MESSRLFYGSFGSYAHSLRAEFICVLWHAQKAAQVRCNKIAGGLARTYKREHTNTHDFFCHNLNETVAFLSRFYARHTKLCNKMQTK